MLTRPERSWHPWELAWDVPRRARRKLAEAAWRPGRPAPNGHLPPPPGVFCHPSRQPDVQRALGQLPGAHEEVLARAELARAGTVEAFGRLLSVRGESSWRSDPLSGVHWDRAPARGLTVTAEGRDPRYPWALGRLDAVVSLAQACWLAPEHARTWTSALTQWTQSFRAANPPGWGLQWACTLEVALRAVNLAVAQALAGPWLPKPLHAEFAEDLSAHVQYVRAHLEDAGRVPNNHLLAGLSGLATVALLCPSAGPRGLAGWACRALDRELERQVHADGWSFEGSAAYHRLSLELVVVPWVLRLQRRRDARLPRRLHRMFRVVRDLVDARGEAPQVGDTDSGRGLQLRGRRPCEQHYLLPLGAALTGDPLLKVPGHAPTEELVWLLGAAGLATFDALPALGRARSRRSDAAGIHLLRSGGAVVACSAGANGQRGVGGHNHNDKLGFSLHVPGGLLVADPGSGSYTRSRAVRDAFRSVHAHAVPTVDGGEQSELRRPFALGASPPCRVTGWACAEGAVLLRAELSGRAWLERAWLLDGGRGALVITDSVRARGAHELLLGVPFADEQARIRRLTEAERAAAARLLGTGPGVTCVEVGPADAPLGRVVGEAAVCWSLAPSLYAAGYGEVRPARRAVGRVAFEGGRRVRWCVTWGGGEGTHAGDA
jgi:hypothetical protein